MKLSIITVNWNGGELLKKCIDSVYKYTQNINFEFFVVDNGSTDGSTEYIKKHPRYNLSDDQNPLHLIINDSNLGFSKANNQAIKQAKGDCILLLNPDTQLIENSCQIMFDLMFQSPQCGILGCRLLNTDQTLQRSCRTFPTLLSQILILTKTHNIFSNFKPLRKYYMLNFDHNAKREVDQIMGACFMIRRETLKQVGLLDEDYWLQFEEVDYCYRTKQTNWKIYFTPVTKLIHHKGTSFNKHKLIFKQKTYNKNLLVFFKKHKPRWQWLVLWCFQPISLLATLFLQLLFKLKIPLAKNKDL